MPPQRTNLVLTTDIPDIEFHVLVGDALDVESDGGDGGDVLVEFQFIQNGYLVNFSPRAERIRQFDSLVFPAASRPSMRMRISFEPKILPINLDTEPPIVKVELIGRTAIAYQ